MSKKILRIDRARWVRGKVFDDNGSALLVSSAPATEDDEGLRDSDKMCVLGFYLRDVVGLAALDLRNQASPMTVLNKQRSKGQENLYLDQTAKAGACWLYENRPDTDLLQSSSKAMSLMHDNDDPSLSETAREREIRRTFDGCGVDVEFYDSRSATGASETK